MLRTCKLIIQDEVNVKIEGLEPVIRRRLMNIVKEIDHKARYTPMGRLGRWDGTVNFMQLGGSTFLHLLNEPCQDQKNKDYGKTIIEVLEETGHHVEIEDNRVVQTQFQFDEIDDQFLADVKFPKGHFCEGESVILRPHQVKVINSLLKNRHGLAVAATGAGKCLSYDTELDIITYVSSGFFDLLKEQNVEISIFENLCKVKIQIGNLVKIAAEYLNIRIQNNKEFNVDSLDIFAITPSGEKAKIHYLISKNTTGSLITTSETTINCAKKHILLNVDSTEVYAEDVKVGDELKTSSGSQTVISVQDSDQTVFYDINIDAPHYYITSNGVVHHNTLICAALARSVQKYGRTIVIVPNKDLVTQTEEDYILCGLDVGVLYGERKEFDKTHTICTWQSLHALWKKTKSRDKGYVEFTHEDIHEFLDGVVNVIVDECHTAKGVALRSILGGVMKDIPLRWGMTGTIPKDKIFAKEITTNVASKVVEVNASELQDKGVLSGCHVHVTKLMTKLKFNSYQEELKWLTTDDKRMCFIGSFVGGLAESGNTLVLVDRIEAGKKLLDNCKLQGLDAVFVNGSTNKKKRKESYGSAAKNDGQVIIATYGVAAVGLNIPRIFNLILLEPGKSFVRTIQSIGRGLRRAHDKDFVQIYDICSSSKHSAKHSRERISFYKEAQYAHQETKIPESDWTDDIWNQL